MQIITTTPALEGLCSELSQDAFVAVDTEFMREHTYWPELCLIQIAGEKREAIIDPLSSDLDLACFYRLMANENVLKVFHAARQDIEILLGRSGIVPHPLFDTQIAAMVCGFGDQVGYESLVRSLAKAHIDKSSRFTDWSRRPLSQKQLAYALSDVTHLRTVYRKLKSSLDRSGREDWLEEEMAVLVSPDTYRTDPASAWERIRFRPRNRKQLSLLMSLAAWREREAQSRNVPRSRVLKDDALTEIVTQAPQNAEALKSMRALPKGYAGSRLGEGILGAVREGLAADPAGLPEVEDDRPALSSSAQPLAEVLKLALKIVCDRQGIAPRLVASAGEVEAIAAGSGKDMPVFRGWRRQVFGEVALAIKAGELAIGVREGRAAIFPVLSTPGAAAAAE